MDGKNHENANQLIDETSPYLLQHAYNPVDWKAWNDESLEEAKKENKPILVSIGYSACHWCHVMERESFEDEEVAKIMNEHFVCIKVDREERPDVDHLYMDAVQMMTGRGGWPLNCFALPDGRPFYGGTYFPKEQWIDILNQLSNLYKSNPEKVEEYAQKLTEGIQASQLIEVDPLPEEFNDALFEKAISDWKSNIDLKDGGNNYAPKFPMPNNYEFLLHYLYLNQDAELEEHVKLSLEKMAFGGIYDQIGGGFARYSTDMQWKVPHFEKMLYDNAQLVSLYSKAYQQYKTPLYHQIVEETIDFVSRELMDENGNFYSALDADSEGEEGKFYCWQEEELEDLLNVDEYELLRNYYAIGPNSLWEGKHILLRERSDEDIANSLGIEVAELEKKVKALKAKILAEREKRIRPGLDDKSLTSWSALMIIGLLDAYEALGKEEYLSMAERSMQAILDQRMTENGGLFHSFKKDKASITGFLEDYSFCLEALVKMYENTFEEKWLNVANELSQYVISNFHDDKSGYFYFNSNASTDLISRKIERNDNVIPASNSSLCKALFQLGTLMNNEKYITLSDQMLANSLDQIEKYAPYASNWGIQLVRRSNTFHEIAIVGTNAEQLRIEMNKAYLPQSIFLGSTTNRSTLELLEQKWIDHKSFIYVCENKSCQLPVEQSSEALKQIISQ